MVSIFQPILNNALIYIDDILLFSPDQQAHLDLLQAFMNIIQKYGIMLSRNKILIVTTEVEFLGMHISNGQYFLQPHISKSLQEFSDKLKSVKQIQQFLGLVNYMADFIPKIVKYRDPLS